MNRLPGLLPALFLLGCSNLDPVEACNDVVDALTDRRVACDAMTDRAAARAQFEESVTLGRGCAAAAAVDDEATFEEACLPEIPNLACSDLAVGNTPSGCDEQILFD